MQTWLFLGQLLCVWFYYISMTCRLLLVKAESCYSCFFLISPPAFLFTSVEGSFCRNGEEPVLILIRSVNPAAGRIQNLVKTLLIHLFFCLLGLGFWFFFLYFKTHLKGGRKVQYEDYNKLDCFPSVRPWKGSFFSSPFNNTIFNCK